MSDQKPTLSPQTEGLIGAGIGAVLGGGLALADIISPVAIIGVMAGVGLGSWFNAWRRSRRDET